jgi:hypothetical protein
VKTDRFKLERVEFMPSALLPGVLYFSQKYKTAAHLCVCGCGKKVRTQLGPRGLGWQLNDGPSGPTLWPSIGNWQKDCRSHYYIRQGKVVWLEEWTPEEIEEGRREEMRRRNQYFSHAKLSLWKRLKSWFER